jgi:hypothetical protein
MPLRRRIALLGAIPPGVDESFAARGYECYVWSPGSADDFNAFSATDSIVVFQAAQDSARVALTACMAALDFDCRVYIRREPDKTSQALLLRTIEKLKLPVVGLATEETKHFSKDWFDGPQSLPHAPFVYVFTGNDWGAIANIVALNPAGPAPANGLLIEPPEIAADMKKDRRLLLHRAFHDCRQIRLAQKANGLSGVDTYEVHALLGDKSEVGGDWPFRFLVKLGSRVKILREYTGYQTKAMDNVPFHLGPRLRLIRCCLGATEGILVSDYVSGAETLRDCAREGRGTTAIGNVFNHTLLAWRRAAREERRALGPTLVERMDRQMPQHRQQACERLGLATSIEAMKQAIALCQSLPVLTGFVHGDLHATNVLVRQGDAVIIDLERVEQGRPMLFDAASLEGGLLMDGFIDEDTRPIDVILKSIGPLYEITAFRRDDHFCEPHSASTWFFDSVRQIRMQARQLERDDTHAFQYAWVLAAVLLHKACNDCDFAAPDPLGNVDPMGGRREELRAMAAVIAERILRELSALGKSEIDPL